MRGYHRYELEDYDEYDEYEDEEEEEEDEEEDPKPTKEELDYLELRQRLKETKRKQMKRENGSSAGNQLGTKSKLPNDNFGSFFGPAKPVIAQRVIQESKSFIENQHLAAKRPSSQPTIKKSSTSATAGSKAVVRNPMPKVVNQAKVKAQKLKATRDYSFLLSDNADPPPPVKQSSVRSHPTSNSEGRSSQVSHTSKQPLGYGDRHVNDNHEQRKPINGHTHPKSGSSKLPSSSDPKLASTDLRKQLGSQNGGGPKHSASLQKKAPIPAPKNSFPALHNQSSSAVPKQQQLEQRKQQQQVEQRRPHQHSDQRRPHQHSDQRRPQQHADQRRPPQQPDQRRPQQQPDQRRPQQQHEQRRPQQQPDQRRPQQQPDQRRPQQQPDQRRPQQQPDQRRPQQQPDQRRSQQQPDQRRPPQQPDQRRSQQRTDQRRPQQQTDQRRPQQQTDQRRPQQLTDQRKPQQHPDQRRPQPQHDQRRPQQQSDQRKEKHDTNSRSGTAPKHPAVSSRPQINKPLKPNSSRTMEDHRPKKKPRYLSDDDDDGGAIAMIRKMFRYNPNKYAGRDEDDSDMEANFDDILREEKRSAKIARREDEEQLRLIEEEEEMERRQALARKKRKQSQR